MKRALTIAIATAAAAGFLAAPASAQAPSTLDGETLVALFSKCNNNPGSAGVPNQPCAFDPAPPTIEADCDPDGTSTLRYDIEATDPQTQGAVTFAPASGPYNGTFSESGTVTIAPQDGPPVPVSGNGPFDYVLTGSQGVSTGPLLTWTADFEIASGDTTVRGRKVLTANTAGYGVCTEADSTVAPGANIDGYFGIADARLAYAATIITPDGVYRDRGTAESDARESYVSYDNRRGGDIVTRDIYSDVGLLVEIFQSDLDSPEPAGKDSCKNGGWQEFGLGFNNQGDCISFFATGGKNEPGQNVP